MKNKKKGLKRHGEEDINQFAHNVNLDQVADEGGKWSILIEDPESEIREALNETTLELNAIETRNAIGIPYDDGTSYPGDFFTNNSKYRKKGSFISE